MIEMIAAFISIAVTSVVGTSSYYRWRVRPRWEKKAIRAWYPPADMGDAMFPRDEELERLAAARELHDSGRLHPPRADSGRPARIYRARTRGKRSTL